MRTWIVLVALIVPLTLLGLSLAAVLTGKGAPSRIDQQSFNLAFPGNDLQTVDCDSACQTKGLVFRKALGYDRAYATSSWNESDRTCRCVAALVLMETKMWPLVATCLSSLWLIAGLVAILGSKQLDAHLETHRRIQAIRALKDALAGCGGKHSSAELENLFVQLVHHCNMSPIVPLRATEEDTRRAAASDDSTGHRDELPQTRTIGEPS